MTSFSLSRRAAELLGPPPDSSINWDEVIHNWPCILVSTVPKHQHVPVEKGSPTLVDGKDIIATIFDVHDDEDDDDWQMNAKKRPRVQGSRRRVTLETTQRTPLEENSDGSSPVFRRKLRRLEKRKKQMNLKQSTIMESFGLRRSA